MLRQRTLRLTQLDTKLQQPREPIRALEVLARFLIFDLNRDVGGRDALRERRLRRPRERRFRVRPGKSSQQPMSVHRRVPVVAAVEGGRELARRLRVGIGSHLMRDLVRILAMHAFERETNEEFSRNHM
jgi:hypothetical protein